MGWRIPDSNLAGFFEMAGDWFLVTDQDYIVTWCHKNEGVSDPVLPENILGKHLSLFLPPACADDILSFLDRQYMIKNVRRTTHFTDAPGDSYYLAASGNWDNDKFLGVNVLVQRMTGRMPAAPPPRPGNETTAQLAYHLRQQELVACFAIEIASSRDLKTVLQMSLGWVGGFLESDHCTIFKYDNDSDRYSCLHEWHSPAAVPIWDRSQNVPCSAVEEVHISRLARPHLAVNDTKNEKTYKAQRKFGVKAFIDVPILVSDEYWGFLGVDKSHRHKWTVSELRLLKMTAGLISTALEKYYVQEKLTETLGRTQQIVERYPGLIWSVDKKDMRYTIFEGQGVRDVLPDHQSPVGMTLEESRRILPEEICVRVPRTFEEGPQQFTLETKQEHTLTCNTTLLRGQHGEVAGMLGVALDVTEMRDMQRLLEKAIRNAESASRAKSGFLARMSHEIRTPMNVIIGMSELAKKSADPQRVKYCLEKIATAGEQLLGLINDVLDMSTIESGKFNVVTAPFDFAMMMRGITTVMQVKMDEKFLRFSFKREGLPQRMMISDERRLSQVVTNLLSNAAKFTPESGEVTLKARHSPVGQDKSILRIEVADNGIGIAEENMERLFQSFEQADGSITRQYGGTGLGLAICKEIVERMGGEISVESAPGKGSAFRFWVPVEWGEKIPERTMLDKFDNGAGTPPYWPGKTVLVAEDIALNREIITGILEETGLSLEYAATGLEAVKMFREKNGGYDLILMDMQMPEMDGLAATRNIRASGIEGAKSVPIFAMTANAFREDVEECLAEGMDGHIAKPINVDELFEKIGSRLGG